MSKADKLGGGSSFQRASAFQVGPALSDRGRAKAVAEGRIPSYTIVKIPLAQVSSTPLNPRRNFGTPEELTRFGEELRLAQLAACVAVTRAAYLALWPDHEAQIGGAEYVLVNGERRFRSAKAVDLLALDFVVRDEFADSREEFLNKLLKENLDRADFDPVERATGVQQLVDVCAENDTGYGAQARAAEQLGKSRAWITNQLGLLALPAEVRGSVSAGETSGRDAVWMSRRLKDSPTPPSAEELFQLLAAHKAEEARTKAQKKAILDAAASELLTAVNNSAAESEGSRPEREPGELLTAVNNRPARDKAPAPKADIRSARLSEGAKVLTAVNNSAAESEGSRPEREPGEMLTAVNNPAGQASTSLPMPRPTKESALSLRQHLGTTPVEQADSIVQALSAEELVALVEELCSRI